MFGSKALQLCKQLSSRGTAPCTKRALKIGPVCRSSHNSLQYIRSKPTSFSSITSTRTYCAKKLRKEGTEVTASGGTHLLDDSRDPLLEKLRQCRSIRGRREHGEFIIEERPFIMQALMAEVPLKALFVSEVAYAQQQQLEEARMEHPALSAIPLNDFDQGKVPIYIIKDQYLAKLYPVDTPPMLALAPLLHPTYQKIESFMGMKRILVLDNVLNPRNIGMILRNAEAFNVDGIFLLTGPNATDLGNTQDILYSRLAVSASRGSIFRIPFLHVKKDDFLDFAQKGKYNIICTSPHSDVGLPEWEPTKKSPRSSKSSKSKLKSKSKKDESEEGESTKPAVPPYKGEMIVVGNESEGVRKEILQHATTLMTIPTEIESLNAAVATGIVLCRLSNADFFIRNGQSKEFVSKLPKSSDEAL